MPANIVVGTQWGDEGKGKIIDILADVERLKEIFHEKASMYGFLGNDAVVGTPEIFFRYDG